MVGQRLDPQPCCIEHCPNDAYMIFKVSDKQQAWVCRECIPGIIAAKSTFKNKVCEKGSDPREDPGRPLMSQDEPFHGDPHLQKLVQHLIPEVALFIETGAGAGTSLRWVAEQYPWLLCWSCEAHWPTYKQARTHTKGLINIHIFNGLSTEFFAMFQNQMPGLVTRRGLFWLDAHSHGFGCTLPEEIEAIIRMYRGGYIIMDDFEVPGHPEFAYDIHKDIRFGWEFIKDHVDSSRLRGFWYPDYVARTDDRGWGLLAFGDLVDGALERLNAMKF